MLLHEETSDQQKELLVYILGNVANEKSIRFIIEVAKSDADNIKLNVRALTALKEFKQNEDIVQYASEQLEDKDRNPYLKRLALQYFTVRPHKQAHV